MHKIILEIGECALIFCTAEHGVCEEFSSAIELAPALLPPPILLREIKKFKRAGNGAPKCFLILPLPPPGSPHFTANIAELFEKR